MTIEAFLGLPRSESPGSLIEPPRFSPLIADPSFLFPEESPDGLWQLFAHSAWGIHRHDSPDGLSWTDRGIVVRNAMRPFVRFLDGRFLLLYERYRPLGLPLTALPLRPRWKSVIECRASDDLRRWTPPVRLLSPGPAWTVDGRWGESVSNPCLVESGGEWRLYHSSSLVHVDDCGFEEPRYIALATRPLAAGPVGGYAHRDAPVIDPAGDPLPGVIGAGSLKVIPMDGLWLGLQNKIYTGSDGRSRSAIFALRSADGLSWEPARSEPLIAPSDGWRSSHVYACDCRRRGKDGPWYLYYNARDGWYKTAGRERIGRMVLG